MDPTQPARLVPRWARPTFRSLVHTYMHDGNREYLARLLQIWAVGIHDNVDDGDEDPTSLMGEALHYAILIGDEPAVRMILDAGVSPAATLQDADRFHTTLVTAAEAGHRDIARLLWQLVGPDGRFADPQAPNCLGMAARNGHVELVAEFLDMWDGWPMDEKRRALDTAAIQWQDGAVGVLLAKVRYETDVIQHALEVGVTRNPILSVSRHSWSIPITSAEEDLRQQRVIAQLVDAGANPDVFVLRTTPLLHAATEWGHRVGALKGLLEKGANANIRDGAGKTALHTLFHKPSSASTSGLWALLEHGASPEAADAAGEPALHAVTHMATLEQFQLCLAACRDAESALRLRTPQDESLLHYAAAGGREDVVEFLLGRGLDPNAANANGWTPLICALMPGRARPAYPQCTLASLLLRHGASARAVTDEGWTALHALGTYPSGQPGAPLEKWDAVGPLVRELIAGGAPLDAEVPCLRSRRITYNMFVSPRPEAWGVRMQAFARSTGANASVSTAKPSCPHTTPQMWASRNGANEVVKAIVEYRAEGAGGDAES
ncbi:ankyrin [Staphylotrichum tortipilum]|uniref:Ankyrin n=1 Tax=Staphylotrichum tortipilum TaxID=2831512 RepID=A0AAN6RQW9_9PEZI|nr:ankyrin [Staphylotrichum longicolle]